MPKKRKYSWNKERHAYRKQIKQPDGSYKTIYASTEDEMDEKVAHAKQEYELSIQTGRDPTVAQYAARWYALNAVDLSPSRRSDHTTSINNYICPVIGNKKMRDVVLDDGKAVLAKMDGMSHSAQSNVVSVLRQMFDSAEDNRLIIRTPFRKLKPGGYQSEEKTPLTDEQAERLIDALKDTRAYLFVMIGLYAGLRREEIAGLRWGNVHLFGQAPYIAVRERVTFMPSTGAAIHEKELKSKASKRDIPIPSALRAALLDASGRSTDEFIVPAVSGGPMSKQSFRKLWDAVRVRTIGYDVDETTGAKVRQELGSSPVNHPGIVRLLDFPVTAHLLRHTYITNLCLSGMNIKRIQYLAGHATAQMTLNIYIHAMENRPEALHGDIKAAFPEDKVQSEVQSLIHFPKTLEI